VALGRGPKWGGLPATRHLPSALKPEFPPDFDDRGLSYLDSTATAQVPEAVPNALRRFEAKIRAKRARRDAPAPRSSPRPSAVPWPKRVGHPAREQALMHIEEIDDRLFEALGPKGVCRFPHCTFYPKPLATALYRDVQLAPNLLYIDSLASEDECCGATSRRWPADNWANDAQKVIAGIPRIARRRPMAVDLTCTPSWRPSSSLKANSICAYTARYCLR